MARRALVIGGSIAGLFAANALRRIGWDVTVFERVGEPLAGRGAGIGTHSELIAVLRRLGLPVDETIGVQVPMRICLDRSGRVTHRLSTPHLQSSWGRIYSLLKDALPAASYRWGMSLERFEQDAAGVPRCSRTASASAAICWSAPTASAPPCARLSGRRCSRATPGTWHGVASWTRARFRPRSTARLFQCYAMCLPEGEMMLTYPVPGRDNDTRPGRRCYNLMWYRPTDYYRTLPELCTDASGRCHGTSIPPPLLRPEIGAKVRPTRMRCSRRRSPRSSSS